MKNYPLKLALIFFGAGALWIILTDWASNNFAAPTELILIQNVKGLLFVTLSSVGLFFLVRHYYQEIQTKQQEYHRLFEDNPHPMWVYSPSTLRFVAVNNAAIDKYGYSREEFLSMKITDIRPGRDHSRLLEFIKHRSEKVYLDSGIWQHKTKRGRIFFVRVASHSTAFDGVNARVVVAFDVDDQLRTQRELQLSESKLNGLINNSDDLIWLADRAGAIIAANETFKTKIKEVTGITLDTSKRIEAEIFQHNEFTKNWISYFSQAIQGERLRVEEELKGSLHEYYEIILNPIHDENNEIIGVGFFARDITSRKRSELQIKDQLQKLTEISWIQSHELRRPLANIMGIVNLLKSENDKTQQEQLLSMLDESANELDDIIKRIVQKSSNTQ